MSSDRHSLVEIAPIRPAADSYDVAIVGGGLAGLTLAIELKQQRPDTRVAVLEKRDGPAPLAAFKVGESTVPCGAHYFAEVVGMKSHLEQEHNIKCGLRFFLPAGDNRDITSRVEVGPIEFPEHDNYQIDRGLFENKLAARARVLGVDVVLGCEVQDVALGPDFHEVTFKLMDRPGTTRARWVVDAAGRASFLKRRLGLAADCGHRINSSWFRLAGGLDLEQWGAHDARWIGRMKAPGIRQYSTNHLMGEGYWIWLIPLRTGPISIGVCADPRFHPFEEISEFGRLLDWMRLHEPQLAATVGPRVDQIEDFLRVEDFAYGVTQTYSPDRWSLVGEAAAFADPLFSPGSDFIAFGNIFTTDLIARDLAGQDITPRIEYYNDLYQRTFAFVLAKVRDMYPVWGNRWIGAGKLAWDAFVNHSNIVPLTLNYKLTDMEFMRQVDGDLDRMYRLNITMQKLFREWYELDPRGAGSSAMPAFRYAYRPASQAAMVREYSDEQLREELRHQLTTTEAMAVAMFHRAAADLGESPAADDLVNPYAVGLRPERWEADGLYEPPGLTLKQAIELANGFERIWADPTIRLGPPAGAKA